ncbi:hypothetical protein [Hyphomonas johnsonii]|uniref:Uncharacterized protein n=1 Tax=Hyphomonas johnsonii MHS-2 TaxID=1280950 RepID=A0A059FME4_9PROT|nr:hypothetical protein [Hyphomonas johnsonii]KCZ91696.1 hypothetical protein HJO_11282 [Hyphomonas johnsonii MHS-2]
MWTPSESGDWLAIALVGVAGAAIVAGLAIIGGPGAARQENQDAARLQALAVTANALNCYHRGIGLLPEDMQSVRIAIEDSGSPARLAAGCRNAQWQDDPISGEAFEIVPINDRKAQICAVFARPAGRTSGMAYHGSGADYIDLATPRPEAGRFCYTVSLVAEPD